MTARRVGFELNPHLVGGTENFLRRLFMHLDRNRVVPVAIASAAGRWQQFLGDTAETHVVPYLYSAERPADVAGALRPLRLDLVQSSYFAPVIALAAAQLRLPHVWRLGGHVRLIDRSEAERRQFLTITQLTSSRLICPSRYLASQFEGVGAPPVDVIHNGVDVGEIAAAELRMDGARGPHVAMLAHLVPSKRHDVFMRAAARVLERRPDARFAIFGGRFPTDDMQAYAQSVDDLAGRLGLEPVLALRELGHDRFAVLSETDVIAMPIEHEGSSNAILEAMALGKPVVAVRSGSNAELVVDGVTGTLVEPDDPPQLAGAILELLGDAERRRAFGVAARARVERDFDIRRCARRYEALYAEVLGDAGSDAPCAG